VVRTPEQAVADLVEALDSLGLGLRFRVGGSAVNLVVQVPDGAELTAEVKGPG